MARKGDNIYKRKDGRWEGRYKKVTEPDGSTKYGYIYGNSFSEVKQKLIVAKSEILLSSISTKDSETTCSFGVIACEWLEHCQITLKHSSYMKYTNLLRSYILPTLRDVMVNDIHPDQIRKLCDDLLSCGGKNGNGLCTKTVSDVLCVIRSILKYSQSKGYSISCTGKEYSVKSSQPPIRVLSRQEQDVLLRYLINTKSLKNAGLLLCLFTGIRLGELCALKWEDISITERLISIKRTMQRVQISNSDKDVKTQIIITSPKSSTSNRVIPLTDELLDILQFIPPKHEGFFLSGNNIKYIEPRNMERYFHSVLEVCGIENASFHVLRHTFATRCVELGVDVKSLSEILGHASISITMNRYVHPSLELKKSNLQKLSNLFPVN